jgi:hypothetical protein
MTHNAFVYRSSGSLQKKIGARHDTNRSPPREAANMSRSKANYFGIKVSSSQARTRSENRFTLSRQTDTHNLTCQQ